MTLLDELRNVEPADPGQWSRRVSVTLACMLLVLVTAIGIQVRVRAKLLPELASARQAVPGLEQRLREARRGEQRTRSLRSEREELKEKLQLTGAILPLGAESLDLAVSLAAGPAESPVEEVRPWQPGTGTSRHLSHRGAEMRIAGEYGEIVGAIGTVLEAGELRELAEISIESEDGSENGRLRAEARLLAYFTDESHAQGLLAVDPRQPATAPALTTGANLPSPFAVPAGGRGEAATALHGEEEPSERSGMILVGTRRYRIMDDPQGRPRLYTETP